MNAKTPPSRPDVPGAPAVTPSLFNLDQRSREIFRQIVDSYLTTGEPVGSRNLSRLLPMSLSPASVRNVMADLEEQGLIHAPHVSAGRLPTEAGLRFFVDAMLEVGDLSADEQQEIESRLTGDARDQPMQTLLAEASQALSGLSQGAGVVLAGKADLRLKHMEFIRIEPTRALVVLVGEDGTVENRLIEIDPGTTPSALTAAANFVNAHLRGRSLSEARSDLTVRANAVRAELDRLTSAIVESGLASWAEAGDGQPETLIVRGRANLLGDDLSAAEDLERVRLLFEDLETQRALIDLLTNAESGEGVRIFIGSENKLFSLSGSSIVVSPYRDAEQNVVGVLGVIGPTRLNYARIVPVVDYTAQLIGRLIGK